MSTLAYIGTVCGSYLTGPIHVGGSPSGPFADRDEALVISRRMVAGWGVAYTPDDVSVMEWGGPAFGPGGWATVEPIASVVAALDIRSPS